MSEVQVTKCFRLAVTFLILGVLLILTVEQLTAREAEAQVNHNRVGEFADMTSVPTPAVANQPAPISYNDDGSTHIIVGPVMIAYLKVFVWVVGAMFFILSLIAGGLGWFFKRTLDRMDATTTTLAKNQAILAAKHDDLQSDVDGLLAEHNLRGKLCPGLRPDLLKEVVTSVLGVTLPETQHLHRRGTDTPTDIHQHHRHENGVDSPPIARGDDRED